MAYTAEYNRSEDRYDVLLHGEVIGWCDTLEDAETWAARLNEAAQSACTCRQGGAA